MLVERVLHNATLHADAASVNQPNQTQARFMRGGHVFVDHGRNVPRRKCVEIDRLLNRNSLPLHPSLCPLPFTLSPLPCLCPSPSDLCPTVSSAFSSQSPVQNVPAGDEAGFLECAPRRDIIDRKSVV